MVTKKFRPFAFFCLSGWPHCCSVSNLPIFSTSARGYKFWQFFPGSPLKYKRNPRWSNFLLSWLSAKFYCNYSFLQKYDIFNKFRKQKRKCTFSKERRNFFVSSLDSWLTLAGLWNQKKAILKLMKMPKLCTRECLCHTNMLARLSVPPLKYAIKSDRFHEWKQRQRTKKHRKINQREVPNTGWTKNKPHFKIHILLLQRLRAGKTAIKLQENCILNAENWQLLPVAI